MRAARLVTLLLLLQSRERMTARALAAELEVSVRTVHRDIEALSSAGVPVYAERGTAGGFCLLDGHRLQINGLTVDEATALPLLGMPAAATELGLDAVRRSAELKLASALAPDARAAAQRSAERVHIDLEPWQPRTAPTATLRALRDAIARQRAIRLRAGAETPDGGVSEDVEPLGLVRKAGAWHVVAARGDRFCAIAVDSIEEIASTARRFERPDGFDLASWWRGWLAGEAR